MSNENIRISSEVIDIAEHKTYLELTSRVCYYDDINLNNMMLPYDETSEIKAQTLVDMPVQAKYKKNYKNEDTFGGHQMYQDTNGDILFDTQSVGTHVEVYVKDDQVTTVSGVQKTLPCLFAKYRIWKRYPNVVNAVKRLFGLKKLFTSWEILTSAYEFKDGIKKITEYEFEANTLLGFEYATPSYGSSATALSLASVEENELLIAEALSQDMSSESLNITTTEGGSQETMNKEKEIDVGENTVENTAEEVTKDENAACKKKKKQAETESSEDTTASVEDTTEKDVSELTDYDLRKKVRDACKTKLGKWCYIAFLFPVACEVWVEPEDRETELDYIKFTYSVSDDVVTVSEPENVKLTVSVAEVNTKIAELEDIIASKDSSLVEASATISNLNTEIGELTPFKEKFEIAEQEKIEAELTEKKNNLIASVTKSNLITKDEIMASEEYKGYVDSFDEKSLKAIVAERFIASMEDNSETHETKTAEKKDVAAINLNNVEDELDTKTIMKRFLGGK